MAILNYTTQIKVEKTVAEIQAALAKAGARGVFYEYDDASNIIALSFSIVDEGRTIGFRLPTDHQPVLKVLNGDPKVPMRLKNNDQARRVAWRITKDWVVAQLAIIEVNMAKTAQVFLPYAVTDNGQTMYERIQSEPGLLLGGGNGAA